jgi:hypothetical protein
VPARLGVLPGQLDAEQGEPPALAPWSPVERPALVRFADAASRRDEPGERLSLLLEPWMAPAQSAFVVARPQVAGPPFSDLPDAPD